MAHSNLLLQQFWLPTGICRIITIMVKSPNLIEGTYFKKNYHI